MTLERYNSRSLPLTLTQVDVSGFLRQEFQAISRAIPTSSSPLTYAMLPTGSGSWDSGAGTTITITRALTVTGAFIASTSITSTGRCLVDDTTDATSGTDGSLQTDGGLSVAKKAYIAGVLTMAAATAQMTNANPELLLGPSAPASNGGARVTFPISNSVKNWRLGVNDVTAQAVTLTPSTAAGGTSFTTPVLTLTDAGVLTVTGAIAPGNTVNSVSPTAPNRTITMVVGGATLYLHAKTTND